MKTLVMLNMMGDDIDIDDNDDDDDEVITNLTS
jgi:hypothetical protein